MRFFRSPTGEMVEKCRAGYCNGGRGLHNQPTGIVMPNNRILMDPIRREGDEMVNPYLADLLIYWKANMDIQIITSPSQAMRYIAKYISKKEVVEAKNEEHVRRCKLYFNNSDPSAVRQEVRKLYELGMTSRWVISIGKSYFRGSW